MLDEFRAPRGALALQVHTSALAPGAQAWNPGEARATQAPSERRPTARAEALPFMFEGLLGVALLTAGIGLVVRRRWPVGELHPLEPRTRSHPMNPVIR